jgi:hypothetical protein
MPHIFKNKTMAAVALMLLLSALARPAWAGEVIDRIVATVNGHIILQSDWDQGLRYEAVLSGRPLSLFTDEDRRAVLDHLIDQELLGEQMKSASFPHATEGEAAAQIDNARTQYPDAVTEQDWQKVLARFDLTQPELVGHVRQQLDLMRLVDAHLRPTVQIDSKSIEAYYRDKFVPQVKQSGGSDIPLTDVSAKIRELLTEQKVSELMVSWLQSLRSEGKVSLPAGVESLGEGVQTR